jgi:putative pyruvate formate lyase activating enzyme
MQPNYLNLNDKEFLERIKEAFSLLKKCRLCPRECGVNRLKNEKGFCRSGLRLMVSSINIHSGEEPPISGYKGAGNIFFTNCNLRCKFCQNYPISQFGYGKEIGIKELAEKMLGLQGKGAHNINLVTPSHFHPHILAAIYFARYNGLNIPIVYNCNGYESVDSLNLLDGIIDIYLPDMKYSDDNMAYKYSYVYGYCEVNREAIKEMFRQVGNLVTSDDGIAVRGVIIRHLILPNNISGTRNVIKFIVNNISRNIFLSIMTQYFPAYKGVDDKYINRKISNKEFIEVMNILNECNINNGWIQEI